MRGAREPPAPRDSLNFRRASLLFRNEFESRTFTIVLHATSSFIYVSVIYGANFSFNVLRHAVNRSRIFQKSERRHPLVALIVLKIRDVDGATLTVCLVHKMAVVYA